MKIDDLQNPIDIVDGAIADAHRKIAKTFAKRLTKEQAKRIYDYFNGDLVEMRKCFTNKFSSYYMLWTPVDKTNTFISDWLCLQVINKVIPK